jgi:hypothetical protein
MIDKTTAGAVPDPTAIADAAPTADAAPPADAPAPGEASAGPAEPHPWADADRPRGLDAPFAPGGEDEAPPARVADERRLTRLLLVMVVLLVGVPTLLTLIAFVGQLLALRGGG